MTNGGIESPDKRSNGVQWPTVLAVLGIVAPFLASGIIYISQIPEIRDTQARYRDERRAFQDELRIRAGDIEKRISILEDDKAELERQLQKLQDKKGD